MKVEIKGIREIFESSIKERMNYEKKENGDYKAYETRVAFIAFQAGWIHGTDEIRKAMADICSAFIDESLEYGRHGKTNAN